MPETIIAPAAHVIEAAVRAALEEDGAFDDVTTRVAVPAAVWVRGAIVVNQAGVVVGVPVAAAAFAAVDPTISFDAFALDGQRMGAGGRVAEIEGQAASILPAERVALNFLQRLSGVATLTASFADAVQGTRARILDTRKTTPGLRRLERYAVRAGGGGNHRFGLADGVLIKDNHLAAAREAGIDDIGDVIERARAAAPQTLRIEVEVTTAEEAREAAAAGADIILLDNMDVDTIGEALELVRGRALVEASGGVTLDNVRAIAETGVDFISVGALTHSAPALDISLDVSPA